MHRRSVLLIRKWTSSGGKERCVRDYARRRVSERNRRKAALSAEITQEGIHRRLKPISGYFIFADWEPSSKQACFIRHRRRFACFPAPLKSIFSVLCKSSENGLSGEKIFRHAECRCSQEQRHFSWEKELRGSAPAADPTMKGPASAAPRWLRWADRGGAAVPRPPDP